MLMIYAVHYGSTHKNPLSLLVVPRVTNIHLSPTALMNEVTRRNKGFLRVHATTHGMLRAPTNIHFLMHRYTAVSGQTTV